MALTKVTGSGISGITIDSSGQVQLPSLPSFKVHGGSGVGSKLDLTSATWTDVPYGTAAWNDGSHYDTTNFRFKPTVAGKWWLRAGVFFTYGSDTPSQQILSFYDQSGNELLRERRQSTDQSTYGIITISGIFDMSGNGTDWIEVQCFVGDSNDTDLYYGELYGGFQGFLIG